MEVGAWLTSRSCAHCPKPTWKLGLWWPRVCMTGGRPSGPKARGREEAIRLPLHSCPATGCPPARPGPPLLARPSWPTAPGLGRRPTLPGGVENAAWARPRAVEVGQMLPCGRSQACPGCHSLARHVHPCPLRRNPYFTPGAHDIPAWGSRGPAYSTDGGTKQASGGEGHLAILARGSVR